MKKIGLSGNQLKLLAAITMVVDHVGVHLLQDIGWLRIIGRLAFPIYAFMIAEGCRHTRSMGRYLGSVAAMALLCQVVLYFAIGSLYMHILVTFTLSIVLILLLQQTQKNAFWGILALTAVAAIYYVTEMLPKEIPGDFMVDYGFVGVMLPAMIWVGRNKWQSLGMCAIGLVVLGTGNPIQMYALLALIPLAFYNGQRGKHNMKAFFYWFYPAHLAIIFGIQYLLNQFT